MPSRVTANFFRNLVAKEVTVCARLLDVFLCRDAQTNNLEARKKIALAPTELRKSSTRKDERHFCVCVYRGQMRMYDAARRKGHTMKRIRARATRLNAHGFFDQVCVSLFHLFLFLLQQRAIWPEMMGSCFWNCLLRQSFNEEIKYVLNIKN